MSWFYSANNKRVYPGDCVIVNVDSETKRGIVTQIDWSGAEPKRPVLSVHFEDGTYAVLHAEDVVVSDLH